MRYLVISDTHGQFDKAEALIRFFKGQINGVLFLGDFIRDCEKLAKIFETDPSLTFAAVPGNCDGAYSPSGKLYKRERLFHLEGRTVFMTHGDRQQVGYSMDPLLYHAEELGADIVLFGHTHVPYLEELPGMLVLNPGSLTKPRGGSQKSFALLEIENGKAAASLLNLEDFIR